MKDYNEFKSCIDACLKCGAACNHCAYECTKEEDVKMMAKCIQIDMECAPVCFASAQLMSLESDRAKDICLICADISNECANECSDHESDHCKACAQACRRCSEECLKVAGS